MLLRFLCSTRADPVANIVTQTTAAVLELKDALEASFTNLTNTTNGLNTCLFPLRPGYSACADSLPDPACLREFGDTRGCDCEGRRLSRSQPTIKASEVSGARSTDAAFVSCWTSGVDDTFRQLKEQLVDTGQAKWLYFGDQSGVLVNFPGLLWERSEDDCGST